MKTTIKTESGNTLISTQTTGIMSLDEDTKRQKISNKATISRKNTTCMNCGQKKSGRGTLCKTCYQQKRGSYVSLSCDNCGKDFTKRNTSTTKRYEMVELTSIAAKVVLKNIKAIYRAKMYSMQSTSTQKNDEVLLTRVQAKRQKKQKLQCPNCDKAFYPTSARTVYCSRECADKAHSKRMREKTIHVTKMA